MADKPPKKFMSMNKNYLFVIIALCLAITSSAQTLFTYGKYSADAKDFLRAYNKNNTKSAANKAKSISDYLDLYIKSRLKIREAYERGYDTLPQIKNEVDNLRAQIIENYMSDPVTVNRLSKEAFQRSLKDIHVAHIFISFKKADGSMDTIAARNKKDEIMKRLQKGDDFLQVAQQSSDDPSAKTNKGDMGYITVFTLPYEFENIIYAIPAGKYSAPYRSKIGYHIFKKLGERKAVGKIKAQQILLAIPPGADDAAKKQLELRADSLYKRIMAGEDFAKLAVAYSNDYVSAASGGNLPDIEVGQYDPVFENVLWSLPKDGAVSKPFYTSHGWHIVKRISIKPVVTDANNKSNQKELQQRITADGRWKVSNKLIYLKVINKAGFKKSDYKEAVLWALTDSLLDYKPLGIGSAMNLSSVLFKIDDTVIKVSDWIAYAQTNRHKTDGSGTKPYEQLMDEFVHASMFNYYRDHLEDFNDDFRNQMAEFRDGNLFFEIMQEEIWNKAQSDSAALLSLYEKNKRKYNWNQSADAVVFFCSDQDIAKTIFEKIKKNPADWRNITEAESEKVVADSSKYEWNQIPNMNKMVPKEGMITTPLVNKNDNTASFAYIIKVYQQPMQRSFDEAKGLVINDYQAQLEDEWIKALMKKYPVVINQKVLAEISK
jgi:peptidyl-prolyl cis-trans isomerase SurA